jgi:FkbM family methyltransferase
MQNPSRWDRLRSFLYRRLARLVTCEIKLLGDHPLAIDNKFQVNSLQDVFCHPFYWQLYTWLERPPKFVVDLGAHCGHFSMLADVCVQVRFGAVATEYLLVEPNPHLIPVIRRNLAKSGLCVRHQLQRGLVGARAGQATLWVSSSNYLSASLQPSPSTNGISASYVDLDQLVGNRTIDLLKVDIEGAEFELIANYPELLRRVQKLMIEIHSAPPSSKNGLLSRLEQAGLHRVGQVVEHSGYQLASYQRTPSNIA